MNPAPHEQELEDRTRTGAALFPVFVADPLTRPRYARWQGGSGWRAGRLPAAVDRLNVAPVYRFRSRVQAFQDEQGGGPLALVTYRFPKGHGGTYRTGSVLGPEMLRHAGHTAAMWAVHLSARPHVHGLVPRAQVPTRCPCCGGALTPRVHREHGHRDGRPRKLRNGFGCAAGCTHVSPVQDTVRDLKAAAGYLGGPSDPGAWHGTPEKMNAAERYLRDGRGVQMRGTSLTRAPKYPATAAPVDQLIRRAARRARRALTRTNRRATLSAARTRRKVIAVDFVGKHAARFWNQVRRNAMNTPARPTVRRSPGSIAGTPCKAFSEPDPPPRRARGLVPVSSPPC